MSAAPTIHGDSSSTRALLFAAVGDAAVWSCWRNSRLRVGSIVYHTHSRPSPVAGCGRQKQAPACCSAWFTVVVVVAPYHDDWAPIDDAADFLRVFCASLVGCDNHGHVSIARVGRCAGYPGCLLFLAPQARPPCLRVWCATVLAGPHYQGTRVVCAWPCARVVASSLHGARHFRAALFVCFAIRVRAGMTRWRRRTCV